MTEGSPPPDYPATPPLSPPPPPVPPGVVRAVGSWPGPPDEPPPGPDRRAPVWVVALAIVAVGALLGGLIAVVTGDGGPDGDEEASAPFERPDPTTTEVPDDPADEPVDDPSLEQAIIDIEAFVATERGLPFLRDVTVELADDAAFEARLLEDFDEEIADLETSGLVLQALGLVDQGTDVVEAFRTLLGAGVVGFYDPATDELVVRGTSASPYVRTVIAHELTHALDDQHFELDRPALDEAADESGFAFTGLVEGNAVRVEAAYWETFTPEEEAQALDEQSQLSAGFDFDAVPLVLLESIVAPYQLGPALIADLLEEGGQELLDASFAAPPTTSEALLDPSTFLEGQTAVAVPPPVADGPEIERNVLGAMGLAQVLGELTMLLGGFGSLPDSVAGWGGDQFVAWGDAGRACVRAHLVGDLPADTAEIGDALADWAGSPPFAVEATVEVGEFVTLTSCG